MAEGSLGAEENLEHRGKCIKLSAPNAARNVKFHSSQQKADQSTVKNASPSTGHLEGIKPNS